MVQETPRQGVDAFFNGNYDVSSGYVIPDVKDLERLTKPFDEF
jgi:hypothetical protein